MNRLNLKIFSRFWNINKLYWLGNEKKEAIALLIIIIALIFIYTPLNVKINQPQYAILDEATSALDLKNEASLYKHLLETNTTFISIGHRESLKQYHRLILEILEGSNWQLK